MDDISTIQSYIRSGESETVEFKKSTGQISRAGETLCGFLNGKGGTVIIGVKPDGTIVGQEVSDNTLQKLAEMLGSFEPKPPVSRKTISLQNGKHVILLSTPALPESGPFTFKGRAFERTANTTSVMPKTRYESLLLQKTHSRYRWENTHANIDAGLLDQEEILRTVRLGIEAGRLPESTGNDVTDILERLGLKENGHILNAAVVLFGTNFMPLYPQCQLRLARFKGTDKSEFLDHKQERGHAFKLLEEAMTFFRRHLPVSGRIEEEQLERIDQPAFPVIALREALVNAFCHRDYSLPGGAVSIAIYDDRAEIWSDGKLPFGLTPDDLSREHTSHPRNPIITDVFFRRGLIELWGRGTQKIIELCQKAGCMIPQFDETAGAVVVRFPLNDTPVRSDPSRKKDTMDDTMEVTMQVTMQVENIVKIIEGEQTRTSLQEQLNLKNVDYFRRNYLMPALEQGFIERTIPEKPKSKNQRYRLTDKGLLLKQKLTI